MVYYELAAWACGYQVQPFDEVISEQLGVIPAEFYVIQHCRKMYGCRHCEGCIKTAPLPPQPIPKSNATPELVAYIVVPKLLDGVPLYRQETLWKRGDIRLPRATMANWMMSVGNHLIVPLINLLHDHLLAGP
jgi:transposase